MMVRFYSISFLLMTTGFSQVVMADGDVTKNSNKLFNELSLGYQYGFNKDYHVALEVFGQKDLSQSGDGTLLSANNIPADNTEIWALDEPKADFDWTSGIRLRPGYNVTGNTRLFLDGGVVLGDFSMELANLGIGLPPNLSNSLESSETLLGWRYGLGLEHHIANLEALSLVLDYSMTEFQSSDMWYNTASLGNPNLDSDSSEFAPAFQQVMLSLKAEFDPGMGLF